REGDFTGTAGLPDIDHRYAETNLGVMQRMTEDAVQPGARQRETGAAFIPEFGRAGDAQRPAAAVENALGMNGSRLRTHRVKQAKLLQRTGGVARQVKPGATGGLVAVMLDQVRLHAVAFQRSRHG